MSYTLSWLQRGHPAVAQANPFIIGYINNLSTGMMRGFHNRNRLATLNWTQNLSKSTERALALDVALLQYCKTGDTYDRRSKLMALYQYVANKKGPGTSPIAESGGFVRSRPGLSAPDIQFHFLPVLVVDHGRTQMKKNGYSLHICTLRPESRGTIMAMSPDPLARPAIRPNYLAVENDLAVSLAGLKHARRIFAAPSFAPYVVGETVPGKDVATDADLTAFARRVGGTLYHPVGTCRMGEDPQAVVDSRLRVRGLSGLRVIDASVMPIVTTGNTNAPTIMIAEKGAAMIREDAKAA